MCRQIWMRVAQMTFTVAMVLTAAMALMAALERAMLVLQRKAGQGIAIGENVRVVVLSVSGDHVRLGIEAPRDIRVLRLELVEDVQAENARAAEATTSTDLTLAFGRSLSRKERVAPKSVSSAHPETGTTPAA